MGRIAHYLNGFVIIGIILLGISLAGLATGNRLLTEPGQPVRLYSWLLYLAAAAIMLVNGVVSMRLSARHGGSDKPAGPSDAPELGPKNNPSKA